MPAFVTRFAGNLLQALTDIPKPERKPQAWRDEAHHYWENMGKPTKQFDIPLSLRVGERNFLRSSKIIAQIYRNLIPWGYPPPPRSASEHHIFKPFRWVAVLGKHNVRLNSPGESNDHTEKRV